MSLSRRQQRLLVHIDAALSGSDPGLASKLAFFARLTAGQPMPRREELRTPVGRIRAAAACGATIMTLTIRVGATVARATGAAAWLPKAGPSPQQPPPQPRPAGLARNTPPGGQHMPAARHPSPLPPDPVNTTSSGSPLPANPHRTSTGSPLPPDPVTEASGSPPQVRADPPPGPAGHHATGQ